jgi:hypothetical protein
MRRGALLGPALLALAGCSGEPSLSGAGEPLVVSGATFIAGPLPGSPPLDGGTPTAPDVTSVQSANNVLVPGQSGRTLAGDVTDDATSVAVRFADLGTGYWVLVPGAPDTSAPGMLTWSMTFDVGEGFAPGVHPLRFAALGPAGAGTQTDQLVCVDTPFPDDLAACDPTLTPPAAVLSLSWDAPVDLDLELGTPEGVLLTPKHPTTSPSLDGGVGPNDGVLDRDSDANCVPDHVNREDVVWQHTPVSGQYLAYANLFSACGQASVRFTLSLYVAEPTGVAKETALQLKLQTSGELLALDANGGAGMGLYLAAFSFPFP